MQFKKTAAALLAGVLLCSSAMPSFAWKLTSHVYSGNLVLEDLQDGYLTIDGYGEYKVPDEFYNAITKYPNAYRAGTMGPDVYPEMATGQGNIHAWEEGQDLKYSSGAYLDIMVEEYLQMPLNHPEREKALAFILGYTAHYSGDLYGHPWVNKWAGGVFPSMTEMDESENVEIALRHILTEGYMDSKVPDAHKTGAGIAVDAPKEFIRDTLIKKAAEKSEVSFFLDPIVDLEKNLERTAEEKKAFNGNFLDYALDTNVAGYADKWSEDIDNGLVKWISANEEMAKNMLDKDKSTSDAITPIENWVTEYGLRISGSPDALAQALNMSVDTVLELLNLVTTEDIREKLSELKKDAVFYAVKESTGLDLEEVLEAMKDPEPILNSDLFDTGYQTTAELDKEFKNFGQTDDMSEMEFAPFYNTVQMAKLNLIGADNLKSIFPNSGFAPSETIETTDKLDIRIRTHSGKMWDTHGTDDDVFFYITLHDGSRFEVLMDHPGQNDFEKGNEDTYRLELPRRIRYEEIKTVGVRKKVIVNDDWNPDWFRVAVPGLDPFFYSDGSFSGKTFGGNDYYERDVYLANSISGYSQLDASLINFIRTLDGYDQWMYSSIYNNDRASYDLVLNGGANSGVGLASIYNSLKEQVGTEEYQHYYEFDDKDTVQTMGDKWSFGDELECKTDGHAVAVVDTYTFDDFTAEASLSVKKGGNAGIEYRMSNVSGNQNAFQGYMAGIGIDNDGKGYAFIGRQNFDYKGLKDAWWTINPKQKYTLRVEANGPEMKLYVDDVLAVTAKDSMHKDGYIGFQVWNTTAQMDYLQVEEMRIDGMDKYDFYESEPALAFTNDKWELDEENESTQLKGYAKKNETAFAMKEDEEFDDVLIRTKIMQTNSDGEAGLAFHVNAYSDIRIQEGYTLGVVKEKGGSSYLVLEKTEAGENAKTIAKESIQFEKKKEYELAVVASQGKISAYLNGRLVLEADDSTFTSGMVGYYMKDAKGYFDNLEIASMSGTSGAAIPSTQTPANDAPKNAQQPSQETKPLSNEFNGYLGLTALDGSFTGNYAYDGSVYVVPEGSDDAFALVNDTHFANGSISSKITLYDPIDGNNHDSGIAFRVSDAVAGNDSYSGYFVGLRAGQNGGVFIGKQADGRWTELSRKNQPMDSRTVYDLKITASGSTFNVYLNGQHVLSASDSSFVEGDVALRALRMPTIYQNIGVTN